MHVRLLAHGGTVAWAAASVKTAAAVAAGGTHVKFRKILPCAANAVLL